MIQRDVFDGASFQGDRVLRLRSVPAGARIVRATAVVTPVDPTEGADPFAETLVFSGASGDFGATKSTPTGWVEVDFHARRTLARVEGTSLKNCTLQVDLGGGAYVEINDAGAFRAPPPSDQTFKLSDSPASVPGLTVAKMKLRAPVGAAAPPDVTKVIVRSEPSNVSLRVGNLSPFFTHTGEMHQPETTPDFTALLQAFLAGAQASNGFYDVPITLHSDTIGHLRVAFEIEQVNGQGAAPGGLNEVALSFDYSTLPQPQADKLAVAMPLDARAVAGQTTARVRGAFEETRIVWGPTGRVEPNPRDAADVAPSSSQAQFLQFSQTGANQRPKPTGATAIDLLVDCVDRTARLGLDIRADLGGRPDDATLLPAPVEVTLDRDALGKPAVWVSVPLPAEFQFQEKAYWIVLQSLEGRAKWHAQPTASGQAGMQRTTDGGFSWRSSEVSAYFRLRRRPVSFEVPIELEIGAGDQVRRVALDRFAPLGRVQFDIGDELTTGLNQALDAIAQKTGVRPQGEHLADPGFKDWSIVGDDIDPIARVTPLKGLPQALAVSPDGRQVYVVTSREVAIPGEANLGLEWAIEVVDVLCDRRVGEIPLGSFPSGSETLSLIAVHPDGTQAYVVVNGALQAVDLAKSKVLGRPIKPGEIDKQDQTSDARQIESMVVDPDGSQLYAALGEGRNVSVTALPTAALARGVVSAQKILPATSRTGTGPALLGITLDRNHLILSDGGGMLRVFGTSREAVVVTFTPSSKAGVFAVTPDGTHAVVGVVPGAGGSIQHAIQLIDLERGEPTGSPIPVGGLPASIQVSSDGTRVYVIEAIGTPGPQGQGPIDIVDLNRPETVRRVDLKLKGARGLSQNVIALTPHNDRLYLGGVEIGSPSTPSLQFVAIGTRLPAEWALTSGFVTPACLSDNQTVGVSLGRADTIGAVVGRAIVAAGAAAAVEPSPTALSQVVPVAPSFNYDFSFLGRAAESDAVAEVRWIGAGCRPVRVDQQPIAVARQLVPHAARFAAPQGATQAEVRFVVPANQATIAAPSLVATDDAVQNGSLRVLQDRTPAGWTLTPATATLIDSADGVTIRSVGSGTIELTQAVAAVGGQSFALEVEARAVALVPEGVAPAVEVRWTDAGGAATGPNIVVPIVPEGPGGASARGIVPDRTTGAAVHVIVRGGTSLTITRVSLRLQALVDLPITVIAQAPGELTVSDLRIASDRVVVPPPGVPASGICPPTPPEHDAGEKDACCCPCCGVPRRISGPQPAVTPAGRPATVGRCASCGTPLMVPGGPTVPGAALMTLPRIPSGPGMFRQRALPLAWHARFPTAIPTPITAIKGIGEARAQRFEAMGIDSAEALALANPEAIAAAVPGVSLSMASDFVDQARKLLRPGGGRT